MVYQEVKRLRTPGRGAVEVSALTQEVVARAGIRSGICVIFCRHTSASLTITENADPAVWRDLERITSRLVPDGDPGLEHDAEGPDDMAAHARAVLTRSDLSVPVADGKLQLGTWQGIFLWEHRAAPHERTLAFTVIGE
jgi:secondary thiamine-phosphate synthase enzyme